MMNFTVRDATLDDLETLVTFTLAEAAEAERKAKQANTVRAGIRAGLVNTAVARYWVLENENSQVVGNISVVKEWSDWHAGFYWWIQSMFIQPDFRGQGLMGLLLDAVKQAAIAENGLELRLYVHEGNGRAIKAYLRDGFQISPYQIMTMPLPDRSG